MDDSNSNVNAFCNKAYILYKTKDYAEALDACLKVISLIPKDTETMNMIANCYAYFEEYDKCLNWLERILTIDSGNEEAVEHKKVIDRLIAKNISN